METAARLAPLSKVVRRAIGAQGLSLYISRAEPPLSGPV